jgi:hypothetical protein
MREPDWADKKAEDALNQVLCKWPPLAITRAFAAALREERERCAKTAEAYERVLVRVPSGNLPCACGPAIAAAIRQRLKAKLAR